MCQKRLGLAFGLVQICLNCFKSKVNGHVEDFFFSLFWLAGSLSERWNVLKNLKEVAFDLNHFELPQPEQESTMIGPKKNKFVNNYKNIPLSTSTVQDCTNIFMKLITFCDKGEEWKLTVCSCTVCQGRAFLFEATCLTDRVSCLTPIIPSLVWEKLCPFVWEGISHQLTSQIL